MRSPTASWLDRLYIEKPELLADSGRGQDPLMELLAGKGHQHEARFLKQLQALHGKDRVAIVQEGADSDRSRQTRHFMKKGYPVIYQAFLSRDTFTGSADFLIRVDGKSHWGDYQYEVWDTKLARTLRPYFIIQLCCYSWMLADLQGSMPQNAAVILGDGQTEPFRITHYYDYYARLQRDFVHSQNTFTADFSAMPDPAYQSEHGAWTQFVQDWIEKTDSLAQIAGIRKSQIRKLRAASVDTMEDLAVKKIESVKGLSDLTLAKLKAQADIQHQSRNLKKPRFEILQNDNGKGLSSLPPASPLDVFFDIEGHPLYDGGLEYLWGCSYRSRDAVPGKLYAFKDWWAHTPEHEKTAFENFIDWLYQRWQGDSTLHVFHYAQYETTALRKLSERYDTRTDQLAELLTNGVFVDVYRIVAASFIIGVPSYSIKDIERLYRPKRSTSVANGGDSVVAYEGWREQGGVERWCDQANGYRAWLAAPAAFDWAHWPELKAIRDYNIDDCESTLELVDWLRSQQSRVGMTYVIKPDNALLNPDKTDRRVAAANRKQALRDYQQRLLEGFEANESLQNDSKAQLVMDLLGFHKRERKPKIWAYFERLEKTDEELIDDDTCLHDARIVRQQPVENGILYQCEYDANQPVRQDKFITATLKGTKLRVHTIRFINEDSSAGVEFRMAAEQARAFDAERVTLLADDDFINTDALEERLGNVAEDFLKERLSKATQALLYRHTPNFKDPSNQDPFWPINRTRFPKEAAYEAAIIQAVAALDNSVLCIQGPPGAGKTTMAARVIRALVKAGKRIGVMSNSHAVILNLLDRLHSTVPATARIVKIGGWGTNQTEFRAKYPPKSYPNYVYRPTMNFTQAAPYASFAVVGATAFAFAFDTAFQSPLDYLFVDEASQVALANLIAVAGCAHNLVLMGDHMQLQQPVQGHHPGRSGVSALAYLLGEHRVIPEDRGIFLNITHRLHPALCAPLSDIVYESKLKTAPANERQQLSVSRTKPGQPRFGIWTVKVEHDGNQQASEAEATAIIEIMADLKKQYFTPKEGKARLITAQDILVVAPYNLQVNLLQDRLGHNVAVGTIDKFQGQEAPVVIISMTASDVEESRRGLDFIFDIHRLNVAVSRAQALVILVASPGLARCQVTSIEQMAKASFYLRLTTLNDSADNVIPLDEPYTFDKNGSFHICKPQERM